MAGAESTYWAPHLGWELNFEVAMSGGIRSVLLLEGRSGFNSFSRLRAIESVHVHVDGYLAVFCRPICVLIQHETW